MEEIRQAARETLERAAAEEGIREIDLLQPDAARRSSQLVYDRLRRRPMVLPVVIEV